MLVKKGAHEIDPWSFLFVLTPYVWTSLVVSLLVVWLIILMKRLMSRRRTTFQLSMDIFFHQLGILVNQVRRLAALAPNKLAATKQTFTELERLGICQKAIIPWASSLHIVTKKDGSLRPYRDYRRLITRTEPDHYSLPNITSFLHGARIFSKLDMLKDKVTTIQRFTTLTTIKAFQEFMGRVICYHRFSIASAITSLFPLYTPS
ncbi:hypothetical protein Pcinc_001218 [Petrolisthes cinctipes]|uniref:Uncharacterized protein n=1 Tax=Petrolisthes cinctipes TaxID=88211 RepID=A0AAE1GLR6_PETCI|nr:hypothetical protein Pcinc_001218 [Petrolisthes cinctipes]